MSNKILNKINNLKNFSILVIKTELILSIGYFITAFVYKSTLIGSEILVRDINNINNFIYLGLINFFIALIFGVIFDKRIDQQKNIYKKIF